MAVKQKAQQKKSKIPEGQIKKSGGKKVEQGEQPQEKKKKQKKKIETKTDLEENDEMKKKKKGKKKLINRNMHNGIYQKLHCTTYFKLENYKFQDFGELDEFS